MSVFDELKSVAGVLQEAGEIEQYRQILDALKELLELQKKISELENANSELRSKLEIKENLIFEKNSYWLQNGEKKDGPFCSCCWDDDRKTIRMQPCGNPAYFDCPKCKNKGVQVFDDRSGSSNYNDSFDPFSAI